MALWRNTAFCACSALQLTTSFEKLIRFQVTTPIRFISVFICIHNFQRRFGINGPSYGEYAKHTFERIIRIEICLFSNFQLKHISLEKAWNQGLSQWMFTEKRRFTLPRLWSLMTILADSADDVGWTDILQTILRNEGYKLYVPSY